MTRELTDRQRKILALKASGYNCETIGRHPDIMLKRHSVHSQLYAIYLKIGAKNDVHAAVIALHPEIGILDWDDIEVPREMLPPPKTKKLRKAS